MEEVDQLEIIEVNPDYTVAWSRVVAVEVVRSGESGTIC